VTVQVRAGLKADGLLDRRITSLESLTRCHGLRLRKRISVDIGLGRCCDFTKPKAVSDAMSG